MSYQIQYVCDNNINTHSGNKRKNIGRMLRIITISAVICTIFLSDSVREFILPYDPSALKRATAEFLETYQEESSVKDAVAAFCAEVIYSGLKG